MTIKFEWEEFTDEDNSWSALFVMINDTSWKLCKSWYDTEDIDEILLKINLPDATVIRP